MVRTIARNDIWELRQVNIEWDKIHYQIIKKDTKESMILSNDEIESLAMIISIK